MTSATSKLPGSALLIAILALAACTRDATPEEAPPRKELRLYVLDCGAIRLEPEAVALFGVSPDETDVRELANPCYVIDHPKGRLLWDAGMPSALAEIDGWQEDEGGFSFRLDRTLADQIKDIGLDMGSFDYLAFSHMHFDHVGAVNELQGGTLIIQQPEHEAAFAEEVTVFGFGVPLYQRLRDLDQIIIDGDHDVFGDNTVRILAAPGHTPGHQVLLVHLPETGPVLIAGDLYHFRISREQQRIPQFNTDADQTRESMQRIETLAEDIGAELWIQHEREWFEKQKTAPESYR